MNSLNNFKLASVSIGTRIRMKGFTTYLRNMHFDNILECGCGVGIYSKYLNKIGSKVICIDINENLLENAKKSVIGPNFIKADIMNLKFDAKFDLVTAADVIEHTNDAEKALKSITGAVNENGILIISIPSSNWGIICKILGLTKYSFGHNYLYSKDDLMNLINKTGLKVIKYEIIQGLLSAFIEGLIVKISSKIYGHEAVKNSQMAVLTSKSKILSFLYYWIFVMLYPIIIFSDTFTPQKYRCEHFVVLKKVNKYENA